MTILTIHAFSASADVTTQIDSLKKMMEQSSNDTLKINILNQMVGIYRRINTKVAMEFAIKELELSKKIGYEHGIASSFTNIGLVHYLQGEYNKANEYFFRSLRIREKMGSERGMANNLNNIAEINRIQGNLDQAFEYNLQALNLRIEINDSMAMTGSLNNLGVVSHYRGEFEKALGYYQKSLRIREKLSDLRGVANVYNNIGSIYGEQGILDEAIIYFQQSIDVYQQVGDKEGESLGLINLGELYLQKNEYKNAIQITGNAMQMVKSLGFKNRLVDSYELLSNIYFQMGSFKKSYDYHKQYVVVKDSLFNEKSARNLNELQTKYESEKKAKEIEMLKKDNELQVLKSQQKEDQIGKQRFLLLGVIFILGLAVSLIYVVYSQFKFKKQTNKVLGNKNDQLGVINKKLDRRNKNISQSIDYAQRIQEAIMPTRTHLEKLFPDSFLYFKAKEVVSGDFPWVTKINDDIYIAAVDCTGHGVPGAIMSMIGYFLLNDIVKSKKVYQTDEILKNLHERIKNTLKQENNTGSKDGMELALCKINVKKGEVQFSGAHRPLIHQSGGSLTVIKGDRFPVGGLQYSQKGKEIKFTTHNIKIKKGESIYFYTDGLSDQLGGDEVRPRSFGNNQIQELIALNKNKPLSGLTESFNEKFESWRGSEQQLDDVLVMGLRI